MESASSSMASARISSVLSTTMLRIPNISRNYIQAEAADKSECPALTARHTASYIWRSKAGMGYALDKDER